MSIALPAAAGGSFFGRDGENNIPGERSRLDSEFTQRNRLMPAIFESFQVVHRRICIEVGEQLNPTGFQQQRFYSFYKTRSQTASVN